MALLMVVQVPPARNHHTRAARACRLRQQPCGAEYVMEMVELRGLGGSKPEKPAHNSAPPCRDMGLNERKCCGT
jgi:hypothetical protein